MGISVGSIFLLANYVGDPADGMPRQMELLCIRKVVRHLYSTLLYSEVSQGSKPVNNSPLVLYGVCFKLLPNNPLTFNTPVYLLAVCLVDTEDIKQRAYFNMSWWECQVHSQNRLVKYNSQNYIVYNIINGVGLKPQRQLEKTRTRESLTSSKLSLKGQVSGYLHACP